ncbi:MAG: cytochrome c oxidase subunit II [Chlorobi bacterium]|nr:MAG: cytochrome c oxidase subunit II [Bacteroidota bacterium]KXK33225.1 MAG: cytochrome c oxidase subunit II [Chlorobi bacterium OLB6]MBE2265647.1 cytochrome c oxidase subunit II [Flavobacteriales bacterium]MBL1160389.1 cytochrome c oxidase subunit II [Chlorobiota bacterium]MBW7853534.1 cytochrome c oxidase subunit II [Candidatus Kapabacteria bacterium]MCC6331147.1 cytochrome c oxidase subunit II [Ignavibacteria bacterium]
MERLLHAFIESFDMLPWLPENISTYGAQLDDLFIFIYWFSVITFLATGGAMVWFMIAYRKRKGHRAHYYHGNQFIETTWTILPTILFLGIGIYSDDMWQTTKESSRVPKPDVEILVLGKQFGWYFMYPGADGKFGRNAYTDIKARTLMSATNPFGIDSTDPAGFDDFITENQFRVPVNANVVVRGSSIDVIHSFFLPHARVKQDVIPGTWMNIWFNLFKTGEYELACAELCGSGHYAMRAVYKVESRKDYDAWLNQKDAEILAARMGGSTADVAATDAEAPSDTEATAETESEPSTDVGE